MIYNTKLRRQQGKILKTLREKALLSRKMLATITNTSIATICRIENGKANIKAYSFHKVCIFFEIFPEYIVDINPATIKESESLERVKTYLSKIGASKHLTDLVETSQAEYKKPTNIIDDLLDAGFFSAFKNVGEIRQQIYTDYNKDIPASVITNALKTKSTIVTKPTGKSNHKLYKANKQSRSK